MRQNTKLIQLWVTEEDHREWTEEAKALGLSLSAMIRFKLKGNDPEAAREAAGALLREIGKPKKVLSREERLSVPVPVDRCPECLKSHRFCTCQK